MPESLERSELGQFKKAIEEACSSDGAATLEGVLSEEDLEGIRYEARDIPDYMRRDINEWPNTKRATLVPFPWPRHSLVRPRHIASTAEFWAPHTTRVARRFRNHVRRSGLEIGYSPLAKWTPTRIGFNYMDGSVKAPAEIPDHEDVETERGLVLALDLPTGALQFLIGADTCKLAGISQKQHSVRAETYRVGLTIAELRLPFSFLPKSEPKNQASSILLVDEKPNK